MSDISNYLQVLIDGLHKKKNILSQIHEIVKSQTVILNAEKIDQTAFDDSMASKADLISELEKLNEGFENVYERIRDELLNEKNKYSSQIKELQKLISEVSEKSVIIETMEERNKAKADSFFKLRHREIRSLQQSNAVARNYERIMTGQAYLGAFDDSSIDSKK